MLLSALSVLVVALSSSEIPEGLMNNPVYYYLAAGDNTHCSEQCRMLHVQWSCLLKYNSLLAIQLGLRFCNYASL